MREFENKLYAVETSEQQAPSPTPPPVPTNNLSAVPQDDTPVCKVAERVVLRKMDRQITGSQLATFGVSLDDLLSSRRASRSH